MIENKSAIERYAPIGLLLAAAAVAAAGARPFAGSWNDGSRLATVECLVDYHTLAIDRSIFVVDPANQSTAGQSPADRRDGILTNSATYANRSPAGQSPADLPVDLPGYPVGDRLLREKGTQDKMLVGGHYYSDKSPVPAVLMAAGYQVLQWTTGLTAREHPGAFCYWMTVGSSGVAYVAAVWCVYLLAGVLGLPLSQRLLLAGSMAAATVAPAYARQANNHVLLLGVVAAVMLLIAILARRCERNAPLPVGLLAALGSLAGLGYSIDLGVGPVLVLSTGIWAAVRFRSVAALTVLALGGLPWIGLHHALNYHVGGTWGPANAVPEHFLWPGSPFHAQNMTGGWNHESLGDFLLYAAAMLFGKRGFLNHNLPLLMALPGCVLLLQRRVRRWPELLFALLLGGGTWLLYAVSSNNYSGACCSVRWFVPLLAPGFYVLALVLRERPDCRTDLAILAACGAVLAVLMWSNGPWVARIGLAYWPLNAAALAAWWYWDARRRRRQRVRRPRIGEHSLAPAG